MDKEIIDLDFKFGINCLRLSDIEKIQKTLNNIGCIFSFRKTNPTAVTRLDKKSYPKRIDNHAKSSEQDGLITFNSSLCKLTRDYYTEKDVKKKKEILEKINIQKYINYFKNKLDFCSL